MDDNLKVHDVVLQEMTRLGGSQAAKVTHLTFYIGTHGPFDADFPAPNNKPGDISNYITQKVSEVRSIVSREY